MDELLLIEIYKIFHSTDSKCIFLLKHIEPFPKLTTPQDTSQISTKKKIPCLLSDHIFNNI